MSKVLGIDYITGADFLEDLKSRQVYLFDDVIREDTKYNILEIKKEILKIKANIAEKAKFQNEVVNGSKLGFDMDVSVAVDYAKKEYATELLSLSAYLLYLEELEALVK